jgi:hypothetical protein
MAEFLAEEWLLKKNSEVTLFKRVSQLLSEKFPDAKIAGELEKNLLISALASSHTFSQTHLLVAKLSAFKSFTAKQAADIASAYADNSQVSWIVRTNLFVRRVSPSHDRVQSMYRAVLAASIDQGNTSTHGLRNVQADRQAQPRARDPLGRRERLKQPGPHFFPDTGPAIPDHHSGLARRGLKANAKPAAWGRMADCIGEQVAHEFARHPRIPQKGGWCTLQCEL